MPRELNPPDDRSAKATPHRGFGKFVAYALVLAAAGLPAMPLQRSASAADEEEVQPTTVDKNLVTQDGWQIAITYHSSRLAKRAPVVILIHRLGSDRLVWEGTDGFAETLSREGYAVVSVDLRKHGQSKASGSDAADGGSNSLKVIDYTRMADNDLEAVKEFLYTEHQKGRLNMNKTAIIGCEKSAPIAINYAVFDWLKRPYPDGPTLESSTPRGQDVRALVLLSPEASIRGVKTSQAVLELRRPEWGVAVLTCYGKQDEVDNGDANKIYRKLSGLPENKDRMYLQEYDFKLRGTDLLRRKEVRCADDILTFLKKHLMDIPSDWRDRQNRLTAP